VIGLVKDVQHLREQLVQILKLEDRMLACEKQAQEARDFSARLMWLVGGLALGVITLIGVVVPKLLK
jgi:hypothetical protein